KPHLGNIQLREANGVHDYIKERTIRIGKYVVETRRTVRLIAKEFGVSKSTVHKDLTERLPEINPELYNQVKDVLDYHTSIRHLRRGEATRNKYRDDQSTENPNSTTRAKTHSTTTNQSAISAEAKQPVTNTEMTIGQKTPPSSR